MKNSNSFLDFLNLRIDFLKSTHKIGTAKNYTRAKSSLLRFLDGQPLSFQQITTSFVDDYSDWLMCRGMTRNSASFHMRILRAVFNKAVRKGLAEPTNPFSVTYTGIDRTEKRYVEKNILSKLRNLDLSSHPLLDFTRDLFLFSLYARGMAFIDIAFLRKENIRGNKIIYKRRKTGGRLCIRIERELNTILTKYMKKGGSPFIFGLIRETDSEDIYRQYERCLSTFNYRLGKISKMLGLSKNLTSYTARHTWASLAQSWEIPISVISAGMGHSSEHTTRIYLATLDNRLIDRANRRILDRLTS